MAAEPPTVADLRKAGIISSQEVFAAIDAYMHNPNAGPYRFASGHSLDIAALVNASQAFAMLERSGPHEKSVPDSVGDRHHDGSSDQALTLDWAVRLRHVLAEGHFRTLGSQSAWAR